MQSQCIGQYHTITLANEQILCTPVTAIMSTTTSDNTNKEWITNNSWEVIILRMRD